MTAATNHPTGTAPPHYLTTKRRLRLPDEVKRTISRIAWAKAQASFAQQRIRLEQLARQMLADGFGTDEVEAVLCKVEDGPGLP